MISGTAPPGVAPGLIRIEADEVSYPLHVILRFEIERDLINGTIEAADIPALWDEKMQAYLGLRTENDYRNGCLQDIHWTDGSFGYFPAYTMGALNGVQLFTTLTRDQPHWQIILRRENWTLSFPGCTPTSGRGPVAPPHNRSWPIVPASRPTRPIFLSMSNRDISTRNSSTPILQHR